MAAFAQYFDVAVVGGRRPSTVALLLDDDDLAPIGASTWTLVLDYVVLCLLDQSTLGREVLLAGDRSTGLRCAV